MVLVDAALRPRHARLEIGDEYWLEPLDGAETRLDGHVITGKTAFAFFQVASLGGVHLTIGPDTKWERLPAIPQAVEASDTRPPPETADPDASDAPAADPEHPQASPEPEQEAEARDSDQKPARRKNRLAAIIVIAAILASGLLLILRRPDPAAIAAERLAADGFRVSYPAAPQLPAGVVGIERLNGTIAVRGLLASPQEGDMVRRSMGLDGEEVVENLDYVTDELALVGTELSKNNPDVKLEPDRNRYGVKLVGMVRRPEDAVSVYRTVREALDPRIPLRRELMVWSELRPGAERAAGALGLSSIRFRQEDGETRIFADPWPSDEQIEEWIGRVADNYGPRAADYLSDMVTRSSDGYMARRAEEEAAAKEREAAEAAARASEAEAARHRQNWGEQQPPAFDLNEFFRDRALQPIAAITDEPAIIVNIPDQDAPQPAPEPSPETPDAPPPPPALLVANLFANGFMDQNGTRYEVGDYLHSNLRLVMIWRNGIVLQRGDETIFATTGNAVPVPIPSQHLEK